jgi:hypothetical protein
LVLLASGVGNNPDSVSAVGRTNVGCRNNSPLRIEPQRGKVGEDNVESSKSEHWAVFNVCVSRSYLPNDSRHVLPHAGFFPVNSGPASC